VVSRRAVLEQERDSLREETLKILEEGVILEGTVKSITDYGAFVDLGGIDGLLHVTDMSWGRIGHPSEVVSSGAKIQVVVLKFDPERERVSLGMKQLVPDPWKSVAERYTVGSRVRGKVVSLTDYGAFIELEKGVEGLLHVSEMSWTKRIVHPTKILSVGAEVEVVVLDIDEAHRRVSLGLKQTGPNPWELVRLNHPVGSHVHGKIKSVTDFGVFVEIEEGIEGLIHISQLSNERVEKPSALFQVGNTVEAEIIHIDPREHKVGLSIKALRRSEERAEMEAYLRREREEARFSLEDVMPEEFRLDRDEGEERGSRRRG
jgi:small subunit ribosomal protein S1